MTLGLRLASAVGIRSRTWGAAAAQETTCHTLLPVQGTEMSLVEDIPTVGTHTTLRRGRAQPTGAGLRLFIKTAPLSDTIRITTTAVNPDTTNVDKAQLDTKIAACQGEALESELTVLTDTAVEATTASRLVTETLALAETSQWTLNTRTASASTRKNPSGKSTAGATKTTIVTATATAHTEKGTTAAARASARTRRIAITVSLALRRLLLVVSAQLQRCLVSTGRRERRKSASARSEKNKNVRASGTTKDLVNMSIAMRTAGSVRLLSLRREGVEEAQMRMSLHSSAETHTSTKTVDLDSPSKAARDTSLLHLVHHTRPLLHSRLALSASQPPIAILIDLMITNLATHRHRRPPTMQTRTIADAWNKYSASLASLFKNLLPIQTRTVNVDAESARLVRRSVKTVR